MSNLRRGFKAEAKTLAAEVRSELGLTGTDPLNPWHLADHLEIPVHPLSAYARAAPAAVRLFRGTGRETFSAVTVFNGTERVIVHNDAHARTRQVSNLAHELAHALLLPPPSPALDHRGCRFRDPVIEDEANWLGGALLVTDQAARQLAWRGVSIEAAAARYKVSPDMMRFRLNVSGATKIAARAKRTRGKG